MKARALQVGRTSTVIDQFAPDFDARNDRWLTPLPLIEAVGPFDLDPCGAPGHPTAATVYTPETHGDGLSMPWDGLVWLNPPYGRAAYAWLERLSRHAPGGIALIFARTDTAMFHDLVWDRATALLFLRGRVTFLDPEGKPGSSNSGAASVLVAYGAEAARRLERADLDGKVIDLGALA